MRKPIFVRSLTETERKQLEVGLHSSDAFVLRRCQIVLASARKQRAPAIARQVGCDDETVRDVLRAFNVRGLDALKRASTRPHTIEVAFPPTQAERLREMLHQSPRVLGKPTSVWTLELAAAVSCERGLTDGRVSGETVRATLARLGVRWKRAKRWITSPDPEYVRKKARVTG